jgi:VanZ like family
VCHTSWHRIGRVAPWKPDRVPPGRLWLPAGVTAIILVLTLWPFPSEPTRRRFLWCLACGELGTLDVLHNILLFMPLGAAIVWTGVSWRRAVVIGFLLSLSIEMAQLFWIPGRDASLSDILTNTTGTLVGAHLAMQVAGWLAPAPPTARRWLCAWAVLLAALLGGTAALLRPLVPPAPLVMEWAPRHGRHIVPFQGRVLEVTLNGRPTPTGWIASDDQIRQAANQGHVRLEAHVLAGPENRQRVMPMVLVLSGDDEVLDLAQQGRHLLFRVRFASARLGLRSLTLAVAAALPQPGGAAQVEGRVDPTRLAADVAQDGRISSATLELSPALGWALLLPGNVPLGGWAAGASALWLALLAFPMGFYGAGAQRRVGRGEPRIAWSVWLLVPAAALGAGLGLVPHLAGLAPVPWFEWVAAAAGVLVGGAAWRATEAWRSRLAAGF